MEINIQIKNAQPEDLLQAFAALSGGSVSSAPSAATSTTEQGRPPLKRIRKEARATTAATRRSPSLLFSQEELRALQAANPQGVVQDSTAEDTEQSAGIRREGQAEGSTVFCIPQARGTHHARSQQLQTFQTEGGFKIQIAHSQDKIQISHSQDNIQISHSQASSTQGPKIDPTLYETPRMPSKITFSKNIKQFRVNWRNIEIQQFPIHDSTKQHVDALCAAAEFRINSGVLLEHDLTWDPPLPTRQEKILFWSHATDVGALWHMLKQRDMRPMNAHGVAAFGCNIFYALGHEMSGSDIDEHNLTRVIFNTTRRAKNLAGIVVGGRAWGSLRKHLGGSYETARAATEEDEVLKDANAKAYCGSQDSAWWQPDNRGAASAASSQSQGEGTWWPQTPLPAWPPLPPPAASPSTQIVPLPPPSTPPEAPSAAGPPTSTARAPLPSQFKEDPEHYDTNLVFKSTLRKNVEPTAWSRAKGLAGMDIRDVTVAHLCRHGMEEFGLRGLSHGKFTGMILTRNIAESVFLSQLQKKLRENNIDVVKEATAFVTPLVDTIFDAIRPWAQVRNYAAKTSDREVQADILAEPHNVIRASGQEPPTSMTSIATWVANLKKSLPRDKHSEVDNHIQSMQTILENAKHTKAELQEMATRWGLPISLATAPKASPKNLQQLIAAVTYLAVLAKSILAMIPDDYITHNEDHANAHLMVYCPTIYNQAAYNTWMDKQTFRILDKDPEEIKQDMQSNTPKVVAKHYAKLLAYEKPLSYGYILMKRKKRWATGRTIIAYSNTCIGKLLKIAALALQQMLRITWPNHFGDVSSPQLWEEIHQLFNNNEHLYPERHLKFLNHDLVGFFNSIPQSDILQSIHFLTSQFLDDHNPTITVDPHNKIVQAEHIPAIIQFSFDACAFTAIGEVREVFQQTCGTSMGNQISPILSTCAVVATEITWLRMYGQFVSSAHFYDKFWIRRYVDNRAIIVDEEELQNNPYIQQLASFTTQWIPQQKAPYSNHCLPSRRSRVKKCKKQRANAAGNAIVLTDIDTDSEAMEYTVRLPHGLPLDMNAPVHSVAKDDPVEQECELLLQQRYIPFEVFPWLSTKLNSEFLRASALTRAGRRATAYTVGTYYHAGSIGVRTNTRQRPWTAATLAYMVRACTHTTFSTVSLLRNIHMRTHRDKYNKPGSLNVVIPVSAFRQGHLWIEEDNGPDLSPNGQHRGRNIELKLPGVEFSPFKLHGTCPWKSDRLIISAYTTNRIEDICSEDKRYLHQLGFNLA
ncbi:unnamed protein product [Symbiodinium sp. CCMP2592]|nr:unnamed protein product [Symbiodinium sp. CCMP2592]